jgi:hypothetical protein
VLRVTTCWVSIGVDISESTSRGLSCGNRTEEQRPDRRSGVADRVPARPLSGVPIYLQLVHQVDHALRLGYLKPGDQPPKVRDVDALLAINPNTVSKAYRLRRTGFDLMSSPRSPDPPASWSHPSGEGGRMFVPRERTSECDGVGNAFPSHNVLGIPRNLIDACALVNRRRRLQRPRLHQRVRAA